MKKVEKLSLNNAYQTFVKLILSEGSIDQLDDYATKDVMGYGTTIDEIIHDLTGLKNQARLQREQTEGPNFQYNETPVFRKVLNNERTAIFVDEIELNFLFDGKPLSFSIRLTVVMELIDGKWKANHFHASKPEYDSGGSDPWQKEEWEQKNKELQNLVDEKTLDLENKNRELEIEAALERVRAVAMGMNKFDDLLNICETSFFEFKNLGFNDLRNAVIHIPNDEQKYFMDYDFSDFTGGQIGKVEYGMHPIVDEYLEKIRSAEDAFFELVIADEFLDGWNEFRTKSGQKVDQRLEEVKALYYYLFSIGIGDIGISTFKPISDSQINTLKRFRNVFDLAYQRYTDIALAEAQAREAEIQLALERVRAVAMSMHKPDDLMDVCRVISEQLEMLQFSDIRNVQVAIIDESKKSYANYQFFTAYAEKVFEETGYENNPASRSLVREMQKSANSFFIGSIKGDELKEFKAWREKYKQFPDPVLDNLTEVFYYFYSIGEGGLGLTTYKTISENELEIFKRFHLVFKLAYRRFIDIQRAEAQAREAQIEAALERTRTQSMLMQHSDEIKNISEIFHQQLLELNIPTEFSYVWLPDESKNNHQFWASWKEEENGEANFKSKQVTYPLDKTESYTAACYEAWSKPEIVHVAFIPPADIHDFFNVWAELLDGSRNLKAKNFKKGIYYSEAYMQYGCFGINIRRELSLEEKQVLKRFSVEFERTYTRFLDLQKAEEQAREARIETALEKVRSASMAMHKTDDLKQVIETVFSQLRELKLPLDACYIDIFEKDNYDLHIWVGTGMETYPDQLTLPYLDHPLFKLTKKARLKGESFFTLKDAKKSKDRFVRHLAANYDVARERIDLMLASEGVDMSVALSENIALNIYNYRGIKFSEEENQIIRRFSKVFQQAYSRFLDLQKAEAQAREAELQLALERVRARTMAMQRSDELSDAAFLLAQQVRELGINAWGCAFHIYADNADGDYEWFSNEERYLPFYKTPRDDFFLRFYEKRESGESLYIEEFKGKKCVDHYDYMMTLPVVGEALKDLQKSGISLPTSQIDHVTYFKYGYLLFITYEQVPEAHEVFKRFAKEFEQTYTRFLDLQKAEAQVRESEIQLALERVRARTMAMHNSDELGQTVMVLFDELKQLGLDDMNFCGIGIMQKNQRMEAWTASGKKGSDSGLVIGIIDMKQHPMLDQVYQNWDDRKESFQYVMEGQDKIKYFENINNQQGYKAGRDISKLPERTYANAFYFNEGCLYAFTLDDISKEKADIYKRFASVFGQAYRRYLDLQIAEARAREAVKQASLDRVRGQISSMRKPKDLQQITPLIWNELKSLEVPFFRCGVFIINEKKKHVQVYLTAPEGKSLASLDLDFDLNDLTRNTVQSWREKEVFRQHWTRNEFLAWTQEMMKLRQINNPEEYQGAEEPPESLHLHFIPFAQGMLYVGHEDQLEQEKIDLVKSLAEAFSFAYARYQDFVELEDAKLNVEKALTDLKATQSQLVHAEKMASLGELTAGIAHEIQNPLNFVNNFAEVSSDIIEELYEEIDNDDVEEVKAIAKDLKENLEKISHHGHRASSIVKGMLEHSRSGSGEKIPTDLNSIADEYLRLAYHGLRAKDKSFNADFSLEADKTLPKINVVAQDIGRVLLNLINNAFYACAERSRSAVNDKTLTGFETLSEFEHGEVYNPTVIISTKNLGDYIEISVKDNGNGIPETIKDKIFQPFFTTKPTGQGTGLGLSMSYDIITKGHGGELRVESTKGGGTTFIILLPLEK